MGWATGPVGACDAHKMPVDVGGAGALAADGRLLAEGGEVRERMLFHTVGLARPGGPPRT